MDTFSKGILIMNQLKNNSWESNLPQARVHLSHLAPTLRNSATFPSTLSASTSLTSVTPIRSDWNLRSTSIVNTAPGSGQRTMAEHQNSSQNSGQNIRPDDSKTNLIINYLPQSMTEKELYSMFVTIGPVESCRVMKDFKTGYSYGFGFVNYGKPEDALRAINSLNGLQVQNKRLKVSFARPSGEEIKETNLYVTNLPRNISEQYLELLFSKYGQIVQKNLLKDKVTGLPRGVAFVRFDRREDAQEAINGLNGLIPDNGTEPLVVKIAEEHGKQKAAYYAGWQAGYQSRATPHSGNGTHQGGPPPGTYPYQGRGHKHQLAMSGGGAMGAGNVGNRYNPIGLGGGYGIHSSWT